MCRHMLSLMLVLPLIGGFPARAADVGHGQTAGRIFHPEQFGAVGDGVHDDTRAIQHCIDLTAAVEPDEQGRRGTVVLDRTYHVTRQVRVFDDTSPEHKMTIGPHWRVFHVPSGVSITGRGEVTMLCGGESPRQTPTNYTYMFWVTAYPIRFEFPVPWNLSRADELDTVENVTIEGIAVIGDPAGLLPRASESSGVVIKRGVNVHVRNVRFRYWHRSVSAMLSRDLHVTGCLVEDGRYIGIAVYAAQDSVISDNVLRGNTHLSGGIYINGRGIEVTRNTLTFTHGIFAEAVTDAAVTSNQITRSPYAMRIGYVASGGAHQVTVSGNEIRRCVTGLMVNNAREIEIADNVLADFATPQSDYMIESPYGYWGFGRDPAGINIVDSANVTVRLNRVHDLNEGVPVGIRVANTRFTADLANNCYALAPTADGKPRFNHANRVIGNEVRAASGYRIGYYLENQDDFVLENNTASGDRHNRVIRSKGSVSNNRVESEVAQVDDATPQCPRLILPNHPAHWKTPVVVAAWKYKDPPPENNEYFSITPRPAGDEAK